MTDDPEPVEHYHWEFYLATQHELTPDGALGTVPHVEINYGAVPNLQLHTIVPLAYARPSGGHTEVGPGDIELGVKYRFVQESAWTPMIGTFPLLEVPTGDQGQGLGTGHWHGFIPLWVQKSLGPWTSYGGGGYWINPGAGNRNFWLVGWQAQRHLTDLATIGAEVFYGTPDQTGGRGNLRFNLGVISDLSEHHHLLLTLGRSVVGNTRFQSYLAYQLTI